MLRSKKYICTVAFAMLLTAVCTAGCGETDKSPAVGTVVITEATEATTTPPETEPVETEATTVLEPLEISGSIQSYYDQNNDTAGWLTLAGTNIDDVVLQSDDNDYYLSKDFYENYSQAGSIYVDYRCAVNTYDHLQCDNVIIYGHNQADGSMFGTLQKYKLKHSDTSKFQFYLDHPTFTFSNLYEEYTYKIIALFVIEALPEQTSDGDFFDYHNYIVFNEERSFDRFIENIEKRSQIITGVDVQEGDKFMTLSTCSNEFEPSRFVVIGRRVRDGESPEVDTSLAQLNTNAKEPDWDYIYSR